MELPNDDRMAYLLRPYAAGDALTPEVVASLRSYLALIVRWNARMNLTAIREPEELVQRQIGESLFAAQFLRDAGTLLDFGSGAGFPGIPLQIVRPKLDVVLAESQGKKASFLREVVRTLSLPCEVWAKRVEEMPLSQKFDTVIMRSVDNTAAMLPLAADHVKQGGSLLRFLSGEARHDLPGWIVADEATVPRSEGRLLRSIRL